MALLIGFLLDQQVPMEWAFGAPNTLRKRIGKIDARTLADMPTEELVQAYLAKPPLHRYPASMARRSQVMARKIVDEYGGDPRRIWNDGADAATVSRRIAKLPGFSANKARIIIAVLAKRLGTPVPGWEELNPSWFSLADVDTPEALLRYRDIKRAAKAAGDWPPGSAKKPARRRTTAKAAKATKPAAKNPGAKKPAARKPARS